MFDIKTWLMDNLINGVANGSFTREYVAVMAVNYMLKGMLIADQVEQISIATAPEPEEETGHGRSSDIRHPAGAGVGLYGRVP